MRRFPDIQIFEKIKHSFLAKRCRSIQAMAPVTIKRRRSEPPRRGGGGVSRPDPEVISDLPAALAITARELDVLTGFLALFGEAAADVRVNQSERIEKRIQKPEK